MPQSFPNDGPDDRVESGSIHPVTWMAIGAGLVGIVVAVAVLIGFFERSGPPPVAAQSAPAAPAEATTQLTEDDSWVDELWPPSAQTISKPQGNSLDDLVEETPSSSAPSEAKADYAGATRSRMVSDDNAAASDANQTSTGPLSPEDLYERIAPSVVTIKVNDEQGEHIGTGSGFIINDGLLNERYRRFFLEHDRELREVTSKPERPTQIAYVVTNYHVIRPAVSADVVVHDGGAGDEHKVAWVVAEDAIADLALLLVTVPQNPAHKGIPLAQDDPRVLSTVYALGSPKGLSGSASEGRVSGFRKLPSGERWLQTTAPISPGSSGGPLLSANGTLVGVATLTLEDAQNINFAIPVSKVKEFLSSYYRPRDVAEGASIWWYERDALLTLKVHLESPEISESKQSAGTKLEKAEEEIRKGILYDPKNARQHYEQAVSLAKQAKEELPNEFEYFAHYILGKVNVHLAWHDGKDVKIMKDRELKYRLSEYSTAALDNLTKSTQLKPDFSPAFEWLYRHHKSADEWPQALVASDMLVKLMPRCAEALRLRGDCYHELNQLQSAKDDLEAAVELAPKSGENYSALSWVLRGMGEYREAIVCLETQLELKHLPSQAHANLGYAYQEIGQFEKAISEFEAAKALGDPTMDQEIAKCKQQLR